MSMQYDEYLFAHTNGVYEAASWMTLNLAVFRGMTDEEVHAFIASVHSHDASKFGPEEYEAYDAYFYGERDEDAFNRAWLHHIHNNPHHWQHWLLMNDDGKYRDPDKVIPIEIPRVYALEMVADWWSFSWRSGNLREVFDWYEDHSDSIILHPKTREFVESVLAEIRERLDEGVGE